MANCTCTGCGKKYTYGDENSPVVLPRVWNLLLGHYGISEEEEYEKEKAFLKLYNKWKNMPEGDKKNALHEKMSGPDYHTYFCTDCMEKALGRKLTRYDIQNCPYNNEFRAKYLKEKVI